MHERMHERMHIHAPTRTRLVAHMNTNMHKRLHALAHLRTHARTDARTHARTHAHMHAHTHARMPHARTHARTHARMHVRSCARALVRSCARAHAHTTASPPFLPNLAIFHIDRPIKLGAQASPHQLPLPQARAVRLHYLIPGACHLGRPDARPQQLVPLRWCRGYSWLFERITEHFIRLFVKICWAAVYAYTHFICILQVVIKDFKGV